MQPDGKYTRRVSAPPATSEATLESLQQLTTLESLFLMFVEGIGNAEMRALRVPTCLKAMTLIELLPASNMFRDTPAAVGFLSQLRGRLRECQSCFTWLDHQLPSYAPLAAAMQGLETLVLYQRVLDADTLAAFGATAPGLRTVELISCSVRDGDTSALCSFLESLRAATRLVFWTVEGCAGAAPLLQGISHLGGSLRELGAIEMGTVVDADAQHLAKLTVLTSLHLEGSVHDIAITERFAAEGLVPLTALRTLQLSYVDASDAAVQRLSSLQRLEVLHLTFCHGIRGHGVAALRACSRLQALVVTVGSHLDVMTALDFAMGLPAIQTLSVAGGPEGHQPQPALQPSFLVPQTQQPAMMSLPLQRWASPSKLNTLFVQHCDITDEQLAARLATLPQLRTLLLNNCRAAIMSAALVATLKASCPRLADVQLRQCAVTDATLMNLAQELWPRLTRLTVHDCSGVSADVAAMVAGMLTGTRGSDDLLPWQRAMAAGRHIEADITAPAAPKQMGGMMLPALMRHIARSQE